MWDRFGAWIILAFTWCWVSAAAACEATSLPPVGTHNLWYCFTDSDTAVVFVHGFTSDSRQAWYAEVPGSDQPTAYWPRIVRSDPDLDKRPAPLNEPSIFLAGYPTALDSTTYRSASSARGARKILPMA